MEFQDRMLKCVDCGTEFVFTAGEQLFFHDKQFRNEPKRCKNCKAKLTVRQGNDRSLPSDAGTSYFLPGVLPGEETRGDCVNRGRPLAKPSITTASASTGL